MAGPSEEDPSLQDTAIDDVWGSELEGKSCLVQWAWTVCHTRACVYGEGYNVLQRGNWRLNRANTHTYTGQDGDTTEPSNCSGEKCSGTERIIGISFCFSVLFWGECVCGRYMIPSFPLYFSLTTNQREKQLKDVKFCFTAGETGTDIPYLGKLILYH